MGRAQTGVTPASYVDIDVGAGTRDDIGERQMRDRLRGALFGQAPAAIRVGRYLVLEEIGSGGLGVVYAAYDPELDRKVALKLVQHDRLTARAAQRMQREAQAMAKLAHPNVVSVHDVGWHGDGVFIAMELIAGLTLRRWLEAAPRTWKEIRDVLVQAGEGLLAAHRQGLVHRDFKPGNVLVDQRADHGVRALVLDFGLARSAEDATPVEDAGSERSLLGTDITQTGTVLGTPAYMAPEQFRGQADARSDQWGFCATAYEALYRQRPFGGADAKELERVIAIGRVPLPPMQSKVPAWVFRALARGMSRAPGDRFASMRELLVALQRDRRSRRLQWVALAGALFLGAGGAGAAAFVLAPTATAEDRAAVDRLVEEARAAAREGQFVYPSLDDPNAPTALLAVTSLERLEGPIADEADREAAGLREEFAENLAQLGDQYWDAPGGMAFASDFYAAALMFDPEQESARERSTLTPGELSVLRRKAASGEFSEAELVGAEPLAALAEPDASTRGERLAKIYRRKKTPAASTSLHLERLLGKDAPVFIQRPPAARPGQATAAAKTTRDEAANDGVEAEPGSGPTPGRGKQTRRDRDAANAEAKNGRAALRRGDEAAAEQAFHRALGKDSANVTALAGLSDLYFERGAYQKALKYAKNAVAVAPKNAPLRMQLGDTLFKVHRYDDAKAEYEQAKALGHAGAKKALDRLAERLGG